MSDALYSTRLRWCSSRGGCAMLHGRRVGLDLPPVIGGHPVAAIDYTPEVQVRRIRPSPADAERDMTCDEVREADALLRAICTTRP